MKKVLILSVLLFFGIGLSCNTQATFPSLGILNKIVNQKPTNAEELLETLASNCADMLKQSPCTDSPQSAQELLIWLGSFVSTDPGNDSKFSKTPYFNYTNLTELYSFLWVIQTYLTAQYPPNQMTLNQMFTNFVATINAQAPVGFHNVGVTPPASLGQRALYKLKTPAFDKDFLEASFALTRATNSRDVLSALSNFYADLEGTMDSITLISRLDFQGFRYATDPDTVNFLNNNTQGLLSSVQNFLTKLSKNVTITRSSGFFSRFSSVAYFDQGSFATLKSLLGVLQHFFTEKLCLDRTKTAGLIQNFLNQYPL